MFTRILTDLERKKIRAFLKADGEKNVFIRTVASRCRKHLSQINRDLAIIDEFLAHYEKKNRES